MRPSDTLKAGRLPPAAATAQGYREEPGRSAPPAGTTLCRPLVALQQYCTAAALARPRGARAATRHVRHATSYALSRCFLNSGSSGPCSQYPDGPDAAHPVFQICTASLWLCHLVHVWGDSSDSAFSKTKQDHAYQNLSAVPHSGADRTQCM